MNGGSPAWGRPRRRRCGLVVDSGAVFGGAPPAGCAVVPLRIEIGERLYVDGVDITLDEVYSQLAGGAAVRTSTPSPGDYLTALQACDAEHIVCLTISSRLSAMHTSARLAAQLLAVAGDPRTVDVVDTGTAAAGYGLVARAAAALVASGAAPDDVLARVRWAADEVAMIGTLRTLAQVARSGRVPRLAAGLGDLVGVRPVFELRRGEARRLSLVRGEHRVLRAFIQEAMARVDPAHPTWLLVCHANAPEDADRLRDALHGALRIGRSETVGLSPVLGSYTGSGMTGFALMPLRDAELAEVG